MLRTSSIVMLADKKEAPKWMVFDKGEIDHVYPFPVLNKFGTVDPDVGFLPGSHSPDGTPPFKTIEAMPVTELLPDTANGYWDIRLLPT